MSRCLIFCVLSVRGSRSPGQIEKLRIFWWSSSCKLARRNDFVRVAAVYKHQNGVYAVFADHRGFPHAREGYLLHVCSRSVSFCEGRAWGPEMFPIGNKLGALCSASFRPRRPAGLSSPLFRRASPFIPPRSGFSLEIRDRMYPVRGVFEADHFYGGAMIDDVAAGL